MVTYWNPLTTNETLHKQYVSNDLINGKLQSNCSSKEQNLPFELTSCINNITDFMEL